MVPALPKDGNWLSAATVRLVMSGPIRLRGKGRDSEARAVFPALPVGVAFAMEDIYAKFVSQKISKTRWRPVPPGSLQTADTFAAGSWDNEVPLLPGGKLLLPLFLLEPRRWGSARELSPSSSSRLLAPLAISVPQFPSQVRLSGTSEPSMMCLSLESRILNHHLPFI